jgi:sugar-specific transcriptional regulator TrmB
LLFDKEEILLLTQVGFTKTQAKIYLTLLQLDEPDVKNLAKSSNVPKPEVYRTIKELQKMGLAEKEIAKPHRYVATPLQFGLQILMTQKVQQCRKMQLEIKHFLRNHQSCRLKIPREKEYKLSMVEGKYRLIQIIRQQHDKVQRSADILTTMQRWIQIIDLCHIEYEKKLDKGVRYRLVIQEKGERNGFRENLPALLERPNFDLRMRHSPLAINAAIFDSEEATINFLEGKPLGESPMIWTNHPSFVRMCQDHFDKVWKSSRKYEIQNSASVL